MPTERVDKWMSSPAIVATPTMSLAEAQRLMEEAHIRRLPVVENGVLIGLVTWGDLRAAWPSSAVISNGFEYQAMLECTPISETMTHHPLTVSGDMSILQAAQLMLQHKVSGLPVVDERDHVIGMITESDLFRLMIAALSRAEQTPDEAADSV
jgi:CBS domain-containing protein